MVQVLMVVAAVSLMATIALLGCWTVAWIKGYRKAALRLRVLAFFAFTVAVLSGTVAAVFLAVG